MGLGSFSATGFQYFADNAVDLIAGTQAASAGMVSANIQETASLLHTDLARVNSTVLAQTNKIAGINTAGFSKLGETMSKGFSSLETISGASLAVQAVGFAAVAKQLHSLNGNVQAMHKDLADQGKKLIAVQEAANARLESLVNYASRTLETQEKILQTLVSSKTVEAQQFIRQGWDNLINGYEDDAFSRFQRSLDYDNTVYLAHAELARLYEKRKDDASAENHYTRATRFAGAAGPKILAFSHLQFAGFLERKARLPDAIKEVGAAIQTDSIDKLTRGGWRIYQGELLARTGDVPGAVAAVREAIAEDDSFFLAAMASEDLAKAQPSLAKMLTDLDSARRTPIFMLLAPAATLLNHIEVLSAEAVAPLRTQAALLFESTFLAHYDELPAKLEETKRLVERIHTEQNRQITAQVDCVTKKHQSLLKSCSAGPPAPKLPTGADGLAVALSLLGSAFAAAVICCGVSVALSELVYVWALGLVSLALTVIVAVGTSLVVARRTEATRNRSAAAECAGRSIDWLRWRRTLPALIVDYEDDLRAARDRLAVSGLEGAAVDNAFSVFDSLSPLPLPARPAWYVSNSIAEGEERDLAITAPMARVPTTLRPTVAEPISPSEVTCPNCGKLIKAAAKLCKHCHQPVAP